jgi:hypothetical protein
MSNNSANPSLNPQEPSRDRSVSGHYSYSNPPTEAEMMAILSVMSKRGKDTLAGHSRLHDLADIVPDDHIREALHLGVAYQTRSLFEKEVTEANKRYVAASGAATGDANTAVPPTDANSAQSPPTANSENPSVYGPARPPPKQD